MPKDSESDSRMIDFLRIPLAFLVVLWHSFQLEHSDRGGGMSIFNNLNSFVQVFFSESICTLAVPTFFIISGFLFYGGLDAWNWQLWLGKVKKRSRSLLLPFLVWNVICVI